MMLQLLLIESRCRRRWLSYRTNAQQHCRHAQTRDYRISHLIVFQCRSAFSVLVTVIERPQRPEATTPYLKKRHTLSLPISSSDFNRFSTFYWLIL